MARGADQRAGDSPPQASDWPGRCERGPSHRPRNRVSVLDVPGVSGPDDHLRSPRPRSPRCRAARRRSAGAARGCRARSVRRAARWVRPDSQDRLPRRRRAVRPPRAGRGDDEEVQSPARRVTGQVERLSVDTAEPAEADGRPVRLQPPRCRLPQRGVVVHARHLESATAQLLHKRGQLVEQVPRSGPPCPHPAWCVRPVSRSGRVGPGSPQGSRQGRPRTVYLCP
jgi:hypothetical protein